MANRAAFIDFGEDEKPREIVIEEPKETKKRKEVGELKVPTKKVKMTTYDWTARYEALNYRSTTRPIVNLLKTMNNLQRRAIEETGFGSLLEWKVEEIPMKISYWLLKNSIRYHVTRQWGRAMEK